VLYQHTLGERLHLSLGGRVDDVQDVDRFATGRATLAYDIWETGTKLRASVGTGAKAPSVFQLFSNFGTASLASEHSIGVDAGIDQRLLDDRVRLSATAFYNRYQNLIDFSVDAALCGPARPFGCYFNISAAETYGVELEADAGLNEFVRLKGAYTYLQAEDLTTGLELARRPNHQAFIGVALNPTPQWTIEPRLTLVGERFSSPGERDRLAPYARLDLLSDYKVTDHLTVFVRAENLTDARYEEVRNYGTPGRSIYGGVRATW
jgi:vitamin B12 transporter